MEDDLTFQLLTKELCEIRKLADELEYDEATKFLFDILSGFETPYLKKFQTLAAKNKSYLSGKSYDELKARERAQVLVEIIRDSHPWITRKTVCNTIARHTLKHTGISASTLEKPMASRQRNRNAKETKVYKEGAKIVAEIFEFMHGNDEYNSVEQILWMICSLACDFNHQSARALLKDIIQMIQDNPKP